MNRRQREAIILALTDELGARGSWCGETHLQKSVYFLEKLTGVSLQFNFILYKHGPFSFELRNELSSMRADGLMQLCLQPPPYGPSLRPTESSARFRSRWQKTINVHSDQVKFIAERLGDRGVAELERLATALYVWFKHGTEDVHSKAAIIHELKPHVSPEEAETAVEQVGEMIEEYEELKV